jgi:fusion protein PurCD
MISLHSTQLPLPFNKIHTGKVRDTYLYNNDRIMIVTDRQSAFDKSVGFVPLKGQVLNQISKWWFEQTSHIVPNHVIATPDPNVMIVKNAKMFPIEVIVRGYITGTTDTSAWMNYNKGVRMFCGNLMPEGLKKNQKLPKIIITPTTKPENGPDESISAEEIMKQGLIHKEKWDKICDYALKLYKKGTEIADKNGLIFVDTKYEFGEDEDGNIIICDEVNTPDSSRYWIKESYEERFKNNKEPESLDKEFLRLYLKKNNITENNLQDIPQEVFLSLSDKYQNLFYKITNTPFVKPSENEDIMKRIENNLTNYYKNN